MELWGRMSERLSPGEGEGEGSCSLSLWNIPINKAVGVQKWGEAGVCLGGLVRMV